MISFSRLDIAIIIGFLLAANLIGFSFSQKSTHTDDDYLLSGRKVGLVLFILTNVATWYGGILGVGEFSFRYGFVSWVTQGLPYYFFAIIFAFLLADKIHTASLFTIPDKLENIYGKKVSLISALLIFILVSPAPYLLMLAQIISMIFGINYFLSLLIAAASASIYMINGGYKSNIWVDALSFFVMFSGFIIIVFVSHAEYGGIDFLSNNLPKDFLSFSGGTSITFIIVWFLIALWTFTDPGFHQRCYSAKNGKVAKWGIIISVFFWLIFDFLTNTTGLYSKAILHNLPNPVLAFPFLAEKILGSGLKGIFFSALIATVISTLNSFIFLSATTFSRDFIFRLNFITKENFNLIKVTQIGILISIILSIFIAYFFQSVVELWYLIGSICIPGLILIVISSYYLKIKVSSRFAFFEIVIGLSTSLIWVFFRQFLNENSFLYSFEPMIIGLLFAVLTHVIGMFRQK